MPTIPYSAYLNLIQNPRCGFTGGTGPTGPTGPVGPAGPQGTSSGLELYFYTEDTPSPTPPPYAPQPNANIEQGSGYRMELTPGAGPTTPPGNAITTPPANTGKAGYYAWMTNAGFQSTVASYPTQGVHVSSTVFGNIGNVLCQFPYPLTGKGSIPAGSWSFAVTLFSWDPQAVTATTIPAWIYAGVFYYNAASATYTLISNSGPSSLVPITNPYSSTTPYTFSVNVPQTTVIADPANDLVYVQFVVSNLTSSGSSYSFGATQQIEFWTEGVYTSQVVTSISGAGGTGATGPTGPTGLPGAIGPTGQGFAFTGPTGSILYYDGSAVTGGSNLTTSGNTVVVNQDSTLGGTVHYSLNSQNALRWGFGLFGTGDTGGSTGTTGAEFGISGYTDNTNYSGTFVKINRGGGITDMIYNPVYTVNTGVINNGSSPTDIDFSSTFTDNESGLYLYRAICASNPERNNVALIMWIKNATLTILQGGNDQINDNLQSSVTFLNNNDATFIRLGTNPPPSTNVHFINDFIGPGHSFDITISRIITF